MSGRFEVSPGLTRKEAEAVLLDELIYALKHRPWNFNLSKHTLDDTATGQEWWISNGAGHLGFWNGSKTSPFGGWWHKCRA